MFYLHYWSNPNRSDNVTISFKDVTDFSQKISENNLEIHDIKKIEREIKSGVNKHFYAFFSNIKGKVALEVYINLNFALKGQKEYFSHLNRTAKRR